MRKVVVAGIVIGAIAIAAVLWARMEKARSQEILRGAEVIRVTRRDIGTAVKATGVIKPMVGAQVNVGSSASGVVTHLYVRIGDRVQKGQLLAMLDSRELVARRDADVAALQLARANLNYAQTDLRRKQELNAAQIIAPSVLDVATQAYAVAEQKSNQAQANLQDATTQLGYTQIFAPISGVVSAVSTQEGETATAGFATPNFVTLLDLSRLEVWAYVDEMDIGRIRIGQNAAFTVDTYGAHEFEGQVSAIHPEPEIRNNVVDYVTVVRFKPPPKYTLRPEMTTTVTVDIVRHKGVLALPLRVVRSEGGRQFVTCRHGSANERRWVSTGMRDDSYWEITSGLQEGEEVVVGDTKTQ
jgi:macrolide-specific efflux system membrane fusion protein